MTQPAHLDAPLLARPYNRAARITNFLMIAFCIASALLAIALLLLIVGYLFVKGVPYLSLDLFTGIKDSEGQRVFFRNGIAGTLVLIAMASVFGVPVGVATGVYLAEYAKTPWLANTVRLVTDILLGVPSIIVGVLAYQLIVQPLDQSAWAGAAALAFIMAPIVARTTEDMLKLVPQAYREASAGVGASKFQTLFRVVLPAARAGIVTGVMLAVARVAGETAPLLFTIGNSDSPVVNFTGRGPLIDLNNRFPALTIQIWQNAEQPDPATVGRAWAGMLVLVAIITVLNLAVRYASRHKR